MGSQEKLTDFELVFFSMNNIRTLEKSGYFTRDGNILSYFDSNNYFKDILVIDGLQSIYKNGIEEGFNLLTRPNTTKYKTRNP